MKRTLAQCQSTLPIELLANALNGRVDSRMRVAGGWSKQPERQPHSEDESEDETETSAKDPRPKTSSKGEESRAFQEAARMAELAAFAEQEKTRLATKQEAGDRLSQGAFHVALALAATEATAAKNRAAADARARARDAARKAEAERAAREQAERAARERAAAEKARLEKVAAEKAEEEARIAAKKAAAERAAAEAKQAAAKADEERRIAAEKAAAEQKRKAEEAAAAVAKAEAEAKAAREEKLKRERTLAAIVESLTERDTNGWFTSAVDTSVVTDYLSVVKQPMDLGTMGQKVQAQQYTSVKDLQADFQLVIANCKAYSKCSRSLSSSFEEAQKESGCTDRVGVTAGAEVFVDAAEVLEKFGDALFEAVLEPQCDIWAQLQAFLAKMRPKRERAPPKQFLAGPASGKVADPEAEAAAAASAQQVDSSKATSACKPAKAKQVRFAVGDAVTVTRGRYKGDHGVVLRHVGSSTAFRFQIHGEWDYDREWMYSPQMQEHDGLVRRRSSARTTKNG